MEENKLLETPEEVIQSFIDWMIDVDFLRETIKEFNIDYSGAIKEIDGEKYIPIPAFYGEGEKLGTYYTNSGDIKVFGDLVIEDQILSDREWFNTIADIFNVGEDPFEDVTTAIRYCLNEAYKILRENKHNKEGVIIKDDIAYAKLDLVV